MIQTPGTVGRCLPVGGMLLLAAMAAAADAPGGGDAPSTSPHDSALRQWWIEPNRQGLLSALRTIRGGPRGPRDVPRLIRQLGDLSWRLRDAATRDLVAMSPPPLAALAEAANSPSLEVQARANEILRLTRRDRRERLFLAARAIEHLRLAGTAPVLLELLPHAREPWLRFRLRAAAEAAAQPVDAQALRAALKNPHAGVRAAAAAALAAAVGDKCLDELSLLLKDDDHHVRLEAARAMGNLADRRALAALGRLLRSPEADVRAAVATTLNGLTRASIPFAPYQPLATARKQVAAWNAWIAANGEKAPLHWADFASAHNVVLRRHVHSRIPESAIYCRNRGRVAKVLTDGNTRTLAYPGAMGVDYVIDLQKAGDGTALGPLASRGFRVEQIRVSWGGYGGRLKDPKSGVIHRYITSYNILYRTTATPAGQWESLHSCKQAPVDEPGGAKSSRLVLGCVSAARTHTTLLAITGLRNVTAFRITGNGANWVGICEFEALGQAEPVP